MKAYQISIFMQRYQCFYIEMIILFLWSEEPVLKNTFANLRCKKKVFLSKHFSENCYVCKVRFRNLINKFQSTARSKQCSKLNISHSTLFRIVGKETVMQWYEFSLEIKTLWK